MRRLAVSLAALALAFVLPHCGPPTEGAIYRWGSGELITERDAEPGTDVHGMDLKPNPIILGVLTGRRDVIT